MPRVTVITPTYNHERFIGECIESVLAQTFTDWEMIVVDDGSSDGTASVVERYADPRICLVRKERGGIERLKDSYNLALSMAKGDLIAILEGDDLWPHDKLARQVPDFDDLQIVLSCGLFHVVSVDGDVLSLALALGLPSDGITNDPVGRATYRTMDPRFLTYAFPVTLVVRRTALEAIGGFAQPAGLPLVDHPTLLRLGMQGRWRFHRQVLGMWRRHSLSVTRTRLPQILSGVYDEVERFLEAHRRDLPITPDEVRSLGLEWRNYQLQRGIVQHRLLMHEGDRARAIAVLRHLLNMPLGWKTRWMLRVAIAAATLGRSTELCFKLGRRGDWREEIGLERGDLVVTADMKPDALQYHDLARFANP